MLCNSQKYLADIQRGKGTVSGRGNSQRNKETAGATREQCLDLRIKHLERPQNSRSVWKIIRGTAKQPEQQGIDPKDQTTAKEKAKDKALKYKEQKNKIAV